MKETVKSLKQDLFSTETIRYAIIGVFSVLIDFGIAGVVKNICFSSANAFFTANAAVMGTVIGWIAASIATFFGNKIFVFKSNSWMPAKVIKEFSGTIGVRGFSFLISSVGMKIFVDNDILSLAKYASQKWGWDEHTSKEIILFWVFRCLFGIVEVILNYILNKLIIFKKSNETAQEDSEIMN